MKPPPAPLCKTGISLTELDVVGRPLALHCCHGWGWSHHHDGQIAPISDERLCQSTLFIIPESYVAFTTPRSGLYGKVVDGPPEYLSLNFLSFIMNDGCDWNFTTNIAPAWRVILGTGSPDYESTWFPILSAPELFMGYGSVSALSAI